MEAIVLCFRFPPGSTYQEDLQAPLRRTLGVARGQGRFILYAKATAAAFRDAPQQYWAPSDAEKRLNLGLFADWLSPLIEKTMDTGEELKVAVELRFFTGSPGNG